MAVEQFEVIVYGATSGGVTAAVEVARSGKTVALLATGQHVGGLTTSGLGWTDMGRPAIVGGLAREFYQRVYQKYENPAHVMNEGGVGFRLKKPYRIDYGSITPKADQCLNLLVPVCLSASHIAYGSIRMEPVFMVLGHSAGAAAFLAIDGDKSVQDVPYRKLESKLSAEHQVLSN